MEYSLAAYTDIGICKKTNQDSLCVRRAALNERDEVLLAAVCDGLGGLQQGEVASAAAVSALGGWFDTRLNHLEQLCANNFAGVRQEWMRLFEELHHRLLVYARVNRVQLGTTLTALIACKGRYFTANIGDSRIYERSAALRQLTDDQSLVAQEVAVGHITAEQAAHHPQRNILLQCLGMGERALPDFTVGSIRSSAFYLLCSDGLVHELSAQELEQRLEPFRLESREEMNEALRDMVETCKAQGEQDNITAILIRAMETRQKFPKRRERLASFLKKEPAAHPAFPILLETAQILHTSQAID